MSSRSKRVSNPDQRILRAHEVRAMCIETAKAATREANALDCAAFEDLLASTGLKSDTRTLHPKLLAIIDERIRVALEPVGRFMRDEGVEL